MKLINHYFLFIITLFIFSCDPDDSISSNEINDGFNRTELLTNWCDNIIIPAYNSFYSSLLVLQEDINIFVANPNISSLNNTSDSWLDSYKIWQHIEMFDIGLAEVINYKGKMNIYPTDVDLIEFNIETENYDLNNNNNFTARGFPAIDYLLHGMFTDYDNTINIFKSNPSHSTYLVELVNAMCYNTNLIIEDWSTYRNTFVNSTENTATSAINKVTNDFIFYFEKGLRANKIGIPAGVFSDEILPSTVEAYYKRDVSKLLALEALLAIKKIFQGKHYNYEIMGSSLESYLNYLPVSSQNNLTQEILLEFEEAENQLSLLNNNFVSQLETNPVQMLYAYDAVQLLVVSFKVDMLQSLSISVDYVDADGD
jgi:hypothetical protein